MINKTNLAKLQLVMTLLAPSTPEVHVDVIGIRAREEQPWPISYKKDRELKHYEKFNKKGHW